MAICVATGDPQSDIPSPFPAICRVYTKRGCGTGFFIGERQYIVTARHVVCKEKGENEPKQVFPSVLIGWGYTGRSFLVVTPASVVCHDWRTDLALLRPDMPDDLPKPLSEDSLNMLCSSPAMLRDRVFFESFQGRPGEGERFYRVPAQVTHATAIAPDGLEQRMLTLDAAAWPGASGSPVFSQAGQVVGILTNAVRDTNEGMFRDSRWVLRLLSAVQSNVGSRAASTVIPFPASKVVRQRTEASLRLEGWAVRMKRLMGRAESQLK